MKTLFLLVLFASTLFISGCASISQEECKAGNWESLGDRDANVKHYNSLNSYIEECSKYGITPDKTQYDLGFSKGLEQLCTFQNGYLIGNNGETLPTLCPKELQDKFVQGYIEGQRNHDNKVQLEKQNQLIEKAIDANGEKSKACHSQYDCSFDQNCYNGYCHRK